MFMIVWLVIKKWLLFSVKAVSASLYKGAALCATQGNIYNPVKQKRFNCSP
jgi:hypothetical protein